MNLNSKKPEKRPLYVYYIIAVVIIVLLNVFALPALSERSVKETDYTTFLKAVDRGKVYEATINSDYIYYTMKVDGNDVYCKTVSVEDQDLVSHLYDAGVSIEGTAPQRQSLLLSLILGYVLPIAIFILLGRWLSKKMMSSMGNGGPGGMMSFGKSNAKVYVKSSTGIKFSDVAGEDEAKELLTEIVDFLHNPGKYTEIGAKLPKGALLVGPPGTGKTLLAKAVAGEAKVPFFSLSGSDFVEMFVGVGASRVRDLFKQAEQNAPCIVFIDEIDAVARQRGTGLGGGHDEREQTLNQLLVEMDGFGANEGIIVLAATNRVDILDKAILRPGRFDRKISVNPPDIKGREEILKLHVANKPLAEDVDLNEISRTTAGFSGADLENLMNEAAISAAKAGREYINKEDVDKSYIKVGVGGEKRSHVVSEEDRKITAYHESGHAILFHLLPYVGPVHIVSIIPTGTGAGGYTMPLPQGDQEYITKAHLLNEIKVSMGGRIAEKIIFGNFTTGASQDIKMASGYARSMVTKYGMSENLGFINYESDDQEEVFLGKNLGHTKPYSEKIAAAIDEEVKQIVDECYREAYEILEQNVDVLHKSAKLLLEKERITGAEFEALFDRDDAKDADADVQSNGAEQSTAENVNAADNAVAEQKAETQTDKQ